MPDDGFPLLPSWRMTASDIFFNGYQHLREPMEVKEVPCKTDPGQAAAWMLLWFFTPSNYNMFLQQMWLVVLFNWGFLAMHKGIRTTEHALLRGDVVISQQGPSPSPGRCQEGLCKVLLTLFPRVLVHGSTNPQDYPRLSSVLSSMAGQCKVFRPFRISKIRLWFYWIETEKSAMDQFWAYSWGCEFGFAPSILCRTIPKLSKLVVATCTFFDWLNSISI